jgi:hypothetical protein
VGEASPKFDFVPDDGDRLGRRRRALRKSGVYMPPVVPVLSEAGQMPFFSERDTLRSRSQRARTELPSVTDSPEAHS